MQSCHECGHLYDERVRFCNCCGMPVFSVTAPRPPAWEGPASQPAPLYALPPRKSVAAAMVLALLFGPLGMMYCSFAGAIIMLAATFTLAAVTELTGVLIAWPICVIWAGIAAQMWNEDRG